VMGFGIRSSPGSGTTASMLWLCANPCRSEMPVIYLGSISRPASPVSPRGQEYACDVFDLMRDDEQVKEEIGFYNPASWADEDGNPVMSENRWKLWRMYAAGLPAMQFRNCRDAFYRTQMESPENTDPDRFRIRFREPQDLMTVKAEELAGAAVRIHTRQRTPHTRRPIRGCRFLRSSPDHETPSGLHAGENRSCSVGAFRVANSGSMPHKRWVFGHFFEFVLPFLRSKTSSFLAF